MRRLTENATLPQGTRTLTLYAELDTYLKQFARGTRSFVWLTGRPGVGKSEAIQQAIKGKEVHLVKSGQVTAMMLYMDVYRHLDQPIILDDVEHMLLDPNGRKLVAALGETKSEKTLYWKSASGRLGDVPDSYTTCSPLLIIANANVREPAIQDRALKLYFDPTNEEVHRATARWYWDTEIHSWIGKRLPQFKPLSQRAYYEAGEDKINLHDWRKIILDSWSLDPIAAHVQELENDPAYPTVKEKIARFIRLVGSNRGGSERTYHNRKKQLAESGRLAIESTVGEIPLPQAGKIPKNLAPLATHPPTPPEPDLPSRENFVRPVTGVNGQPATRQVNAEADDSVGWERPPPVDDGD